MKKYYITGVSGTGKSTLTEEFRKRGFNSVDLDSGFCKWKNIETGKDADVNEKIQQGFYDENDWYCDLEKIREFLDQQKEAVFVFGACANQGSFLSSFDKIFLLKCSPEIFSKRIDLRTDNDYGKLLQEKENELLWFEEFNDNMLKEGAIVINAENSLVQVADEIIAKSEYKHIPFSSQIKF